MKKKVFFILLIIINLASAKAQTIYLGYSPAGLCRDNYGNVYILCTGYNKVCKMTPSGVLSDLGTTGSYPQSFCIDASGNVYTANYNSNNVTKITPSGISSILGSTGAGSHPFDICVDASGNIYTANFYTNNVSKITPTGTVSILGTTGSEPNAICLDAAGNVYTANCSANNVSKITPSGVSSILGTTGTHPYAITIDAAGNVYTANYVSNNVSKITPSGVSTILGTTGSQPYSIVLDAAGNIYTTNYGSDNISKITPAGISSIYGTTGTNPVDLVLGSCDCMYVANWGSGNLSVLGTITPAPAGSSVQTYLCSGTIADLSVTGSNVLWYTAAVGGTLLTTSTLLVNNTHYYASQTAGSCESLARLDVKAMRTSGPAPTGNATQTFLCTGTIAYLSATGSNIQWYASPSGGVPLPDTTALADATHYYASQTVSCESILRLDVKAVRTSSPAPTGNATQTFLCTGTIADLSDTGTNVQWYASPTGGVPLPDTTALANSTHYYASQTVAGCESDGRLAVTAIRLSSAPPTGISAQTFLCTGTIANLSANGTNIQWYDSPAGGITLSNTTALTDSTHYYVSQTIAGCESDGRLAVTAIRLSSAPPTGISAQTFLCTGTIANLSATGTNIQWYDSQTGGVTLLDTTALADSTHYYASQTIAGCESDGRFAVTAIRLSSAPPTGNSTQTFLCTGTIADLSANGTNIQWYDSPAGGIILSNTTALTDSTHYYASQTIAGCESDDRLAVTAIRLSSIAPAGDSVQTLLAGSTIADLQASGINIQWYDNPNGGVSLPLTTVLANNNHYYATQTLNGCESYFFDVRVNLIFPVIDICYVEFDKLHAKNKIIWSNSTNNTLDSVFIYREITFNTWSKIGSAPYSMGYFIDLTSNPISQAYNYKISALNINNYEGVKSANHKTMILVKSYDAQSNSYGFSWSSYEGISVGTYNIYGVDINGINSLIGSVPGNNYMFNYTNPDINFVNYFVGFDAQSCTQKSFHIVQSNYVHSVTYGVEDYGLSEIKYFPNPVFKILTITNVLVKSKITVFDMFGKAVLEQQANDVSTDIDFSNLADGLYIVEIRNNSDAIRIKVLKK